LNGNLIVSAPIPLDKELKESLGQVHEHMLLR